MGEHETGQSPGIPAHDAALDARVADHLRDVPPADDLTRRRHLQAALEAFDAHTGAVPERRARWSVRSQRVFGAVAAAAIVMIGLGVVASIGRPDPSLEVMRAALTHEGVTEAADAEPSAKAPTTTNESDAEDSASMALAAPEGQFFVAEIAGSCVQVLDEEFTRQARAAGVLYDPSLPVTVQEGSEDTVRILTAEGLEVVVDLGTCALLEPSGDAGPGASR